MNKISRVSSYFLIAILLLGVFFVATPKAAKAATTLAVVNPLDGTNNFFFTTGTKAVGSTFAINITVNGVTNMGTWQALITWDPTLLTFQSFVLPSDNVLAYSGPISANTVGSGNIACGATVGPGTLTGFTGSGTCAVLTLKIIQGVGLAPLPTSVSCTLGGFGVIGTDTYLLDLNLAPIDFTPVNGAYKFSWVQPTTIPSFYLSPTPIKPASNGSTFAVNVYVNNVDPAWEITGFQFSIMWNTTLIAPVAPFFTNGTFLETFEYAPGGVLYATDINTHDRVPPLHSLESMGLPDYNYSIVGELMLPDFAPPYNGTYHPPFPSTASGPGLLGTFYFQAIYATVSPALALSSIDFIVEDMLVLNHNNQPIGADPITGLFTGSLTGAAYQAPQTVTGLAIDVYTQYPYPFGGQGGNMTSDSFGPQQEVTLCINLTYNGYPVANKLIGFQIFHQPTNATFSAYNFTRSAMTDVNGVACISFRLPWPVNDPVNQIFGWWYVNATGEVAEQTVVDNLRFWVWWPVQVVSIEPKFTSITQGTPGQTMNFTITYLTYHMQPQQVLLTGTVYDELGYFVGADSFMTTVSDPASNYPPDMMPGNPLPQVYTHDFSIPLTPNAVVGKGIIYGNAFSDWPWNGGVPYCPEVTNTIDFYIKKP